MQKLTLTKALYVLAGLLAVAGLLVKISVNPGWEILWVLGAAAMVAHLVTDWVHKQNDNAS